MAQHYKGEDYDPFPYDYEKNKKEIKRSFIDAINDLNEELYENFGESSYLFSYETDGYEDLILFGKHVLYSSEMEEREWIEEQNDYEPIATFIKRIFNEEVDKLVKMKFKLKQYERE